MKYIIIFGAIIIFLIIYTVVSTANSLKKAPERLNKAKKLFAGGDSNAALKELGEAFALPFGNKITPEYKVHLLGVLDLLKEILNGMNISSDKMISRLHTRLSEATKTIEIEEFLYKPVQEFFENTESDEKLAEYLKKAAMSGEIGVVATDEESGPTTSARTTEFINRAGKFLLKGNPKEAIEVYNEALTQTWDKHDEAFLYDQLGSCHLMNNDLVTAEANYKKSIGIDAYFTNVWNYCDFLIYNKRKADAEVQLPQLAKLIKTNIDQKEYDKLFKKWNEL